MKNPVSIATENFIKTIYQFGQKKGHDTRPGSIARELGISNAAATDMARKLARKDLIQYEKYKELRLTPAGRKMALGIIRKHRLWETFLHQVFGLGMHEIHREAEMLEHLTSDFLADRISLFLGHPTTDPHGDPIPDPKGEMPDDPDNILLSQAPAGDSYRVTRLSGSDKEFFEFCQARSLSVGSLLRVKSQLPKRRMTEIELEGTVLLLNADLAQTMHVKPTASAPRERKTLAVAKQARR